MNWYSRFIVIVLLFGVAPDGRSQVLAPDNKNLFIEDAKTAKKAKKDTEAAVLKDEKLHGKDIDLAAPNVEYNKEKGTVLGSGGALISGFGTRGQADTAEVNTQTKDVAMQGGLLLSGALGEVSAASGTANFERETGSFDSADLTFDEGDYEATSRKLDKLSEFDYQFEDASFSTCHCQDGTKPWSIDCKRAYVTEEGYAHTYGTTFKFQGVPVLYSPYFVFPAKRERATGLLAPSFGLSNKDGFIARAPLFVVLDDSSDLRLRPFVETQSRFGTGLDYRQAFSEESFLSTTLSYSDESARGNNLNGAYYIDPSDTSTPIANLDQMTSPAFSANRFGFAHTQMWKTKQGSAMPASFIADVHHVSDDLFLKELADQDIGNQQNRYLTSTALLRGSPTEYLTAQISGEETQYLDSTNDDTAFRRIPEFGLSEFKSFNPFGTNPLGAKLLTQTNFLTSDFARNSGYDGWRMAVNPGVSVPFHFGNVLDNSLQLGMRHNSYRLGNDIDPSTDQPLVGRDSKNFYSFGATTAAVMERVYDLPTENWLKTVTSLGAENSNSKLTRIKHSIEPSINFNLVPKTNVNGLPLFDSQDRLHGRSLTTFRLDNTIYGKFLSTSQVGEPIEELAPRVEDLPVISLDELNPTGADDGLRSGGALAKRRSNVRQLFRFGVVESYDYFLANQAEVVGGDPVAKPWSDLGSYVIFSPSSNFAFSLGSNYNFNDRYASQWVFGVHAIDDRGDSLRFRYNFIKQNQKVGADYQPTVTIDQPEASAEVKLSDQVKLGYYARYDDIKNNFIDHKVALRFYDNCRCWHADIGFRETINPDKQVFLLSFSFNGLGDISQSVFSRQPNEPTGS